MHIVEGLVDTAELLSVCDEFVDLELAGHVVVDQATHLAASLDTTEGASLPDTTSDELECCFLLASC